MKTPILFIIFNRLDTTKQVFEEIRKAQPKQLFIAGDGARKGEEHEVNKDRRYVLDNINWDCKVKTLFRKKNLGCKYAVSGAITWFFKNVKQGIILEDDCLPDQSFFKFCEEMLEKYKDDKKIMQISGNNIQEGWKRDKYSYYFSNYGSIWGWATWKRAWDLYDIDMVNWEEIKNKDYLYDIFRDRIEVLFRTRHFNQVCNDSFDTWDYQWVFAKLINSGLSIIPNNNLVINLGLDKGTRDFSKSDFRVNLKKEEIKFPLLHPPFIIKDYQSDKRHFSKVIKNSIKHKIFK